jgi:hypothetical protein
VRKFGFSPEPLVIGHHNEVLRIWNNYGYFIDSPTDDGCSGGFSLSRAGLRAALFARVLPALGVERA